MPQAGRGKSVIREMIVEAMDAPRRALSEAWASKALGDRGGRSSDEKAEELYDRIYDALRKIRWPKWVHDYDVQSYGNRTELDITLSDPEWMETDDEMVFMSRGDDINRLFSQIAIKAGIKPGMETDEHHERGARDPRGGRVTYTMSWTFKADRDYVGD